MKKLIIVACTLLFLTGCGMSKEEKEKMLFDSLEKAYTVSYAVDGAGLAVNAEETVEMNGRKWYQVDMDDYEKLSQLEVLADDVYDKDTAKKIKKSVNEKYVESNSTLYSISEGGCAFDYNLDDKLRENLEKSINEIKFKMFNRVVFEYKGKEYKAKKTDDGYVFDEQIFVCPSQEE